MYDQSSILIAIVLLWSTSGPWWGSRSRRHD